MAEKEDNVTDINAARHPPSKTIQRPANQCRLVITLEVMVEPEGLATLPNYQKDATDYMRVLIEHADWKEIEEHIIEDLYTEYVTVISVEAKANK